MLRPTFTTRRPAASLAAVFFLAFAALLAAPPAHAAKITKGPYLQNVGATYVTICWVTDRPSPATLSYASADSNLSNSTIVNVPKGADNACATLKSLAPATNYLYRVAAAGEASNIYPFRTAPGPGESFRFVAYGDSRSNERAHRNVVNAIMVEKPGFVINTGDIVNKGTVPEDWDMFFRSTGPLMRTTPYYVAIGNHEQNHADFFKYFSFPGAERYYSFNYGGSHFVILDSNMPFRVDPKQKKWLTDDLEANKSADFTFVFFHHPPYSSGKHGSDVPLRELFGGIFKKYGVDAVINGHDHHYERAEPGDGIVYVVSGGGGAELRNVGQSEWTKSTAKAYHFVAFTVTPNSWKAVVKTPDGRIIDTFSGVKK